MLPETYTVREVSEILGISPSTIYDQVRAGRATALQPIVCGFPKRHIDRLVGKDNA